MNAFKKFNLFFIVLAIFFILTCEKKSPTETEIITGTVTDIDGNTYKTVKIDDKWWMAENLKVTHYRNGDAIPNVKEGSTWANLTTGANCYYNNDEVYADTFGLIYNWYAVDDIRNIAPEGWHVPTNDELKDFVSFVGTRERYRFNEPQLTYVTNESGFSALQGGYRDPEGKFTSIEMQTYFWSSTWHSFILNRSWELHFYGTDASIIDKSTLSMTAGCYIRCVKGDVPPRTLTHIQVTPATAILEKGKVQQFKCITHYSDSRTIDVTHDTEWTISPSTAGRIEENGLFIPPSSYMGTVTITAKCHGHSKNATVRVVEYTHETGSVTDIDGNVYRTVRIGNQWWMAENLKVKHFQNGDPISRGTIRIDWKNLSTGAYCAYENDESNAATYGYLYNWFAVNDDRKIAPEGWHVPSDNEWKTLETYIGMSQSELDEWIINRGADEGGKIKETGTEHWEGINTGATNESGFSALPGGLYSSTGDYFSGMTQTAWFWSSTETDKESLLLPIVGDSTYAWVRSVSYNGARLSRYPLDKINGYSVRCVRD